MGHNEIFGMFFEEETVCWKALKECHSRKRHVVSCYFFRIRNSNKQSTEDQVQLRKLPCLGAQAAEQGMNWNAFWTCPCEAVRLWDLTDHQLWLYEINLSSCAAFFRRCGIWDLASTLQLGLSSPFYCRLCMIFLLACGIRYVGHFGQNTSRGFVEKNLRKSRRVSCCLCRADRKSVV